MRFMTHKSSFVMRPIGTRKRVLLVGATPSDAARRSEFLRHRGYDVDSVTCGEAAVEISRSHSHDLIVLPVELTNGCLEKFFRRLLGLIANSMIDRCADFKQPPPPL